MQGIYHRITYMNSVEKETTLTKRVYSSGSRALGFLAYMFFQILSVLANVIVMTTKKRFISSSLLGTSFFLLNVDFIHYKDINVRVWTFISPFNNFVDKHKLWLY